MKKGHQALSLTLSAMLLVVLLTTLLSCSSQPRRIISPTISEADNLYRMGKRFSAQGQYDSALRSYRAAHDRYAIIDHLEGMVLSRIAVIGTLAKQNSTENLGQKTAELETFINAAAPEFQDNLLLLRTELAFIAGNHPEVNGLTERFKSQDTVIESQILSYRMMSRTKENLSAKGEFRRLQRNSKHLRKAYRKRRLGEIGIYSYVNYVLGYYSYAQNNWNDALRFFEASLSADKDTDNTSGIGQNLYYIALVYRQKGNQDLASIYFQRALQIFTLLKDEASIKMIEQAIRN